MLVILAVAAGLVVLVLLIHLTALLRVRDLLPRLPGPRVRIITVVLAAILAHLIEISCFAVVVGWLVESGEHGALHGSRGDGLQEMFYFSAVTFTSLGYGDITPGGHLRLLAAVEALTGIVLITWSASFTFLAMQRYWGHSNQGDP